MSTRHTLSTCAVILMLSASAHAQNALYSGTIDAVNGNVVTSIGQSFKSDVKDSVLELTSGAAQGKRFLVTDYQTEILWCDTGLLNSYSTSVEGAGARAGDEFNLLQTAQLTAGTASRRDSVSIQDSSVAWPENTYQGQYLYLNGIVSGSSVESLFEITRNTSTTLFVGGTLPAYETVSYKVIANPSSITPAQNYPQLQLGTDSILTADGYQRSIIFVLTPGKHFSLNLVDPYIAILDPLGRLFFLRSNRWRRKAVPIAEGIFVGASTEGACGVFLLGPNLPKGRYIVYGVLNTPEASVYDQKYWRSNLARTQFYI